ncbi:hypothetical protein [Wohlfahrtiimonas populi]|uniref:hypothetical protein n=1 Tax=Wohlfahrtiimonas populi TaxID=1940240 RepID=UPI00098D1C10|nr:hypothetical protein [Wohlfahrtiimonas populi]
MNKIIRFTVVASMIALLAGCSTWNGMSSREKKMVGGAAVGAATGAWIFDGAVLGTVGGAAVGGLVGDQLGK